MKSRREFVKLAAAGSLLGLTRATAAAPGASPEAPAAPADERAAWLQIAQKLATPVLGALARRELKAVMPVEARDPAARAPYTHLEALGRLLAGLAPWLELGADGPAEGEARARFAQLAREGIDAATDPGSPDFMNFDRGQQPVVDAAFLAQALLRAPGALWTALEPRVRANVIAALKSSRVIRPPETNWLLFASIIEAALHRCGERRDERRLADGLDKFRQWYLGDGIYGDGPEFHWDYYNAFVIHPMLVEILDVVGDETASWRSLTSGARQRLTRYAAIEERLVAPDGSYPAVGRSICYRCGAFQGLALAALRHALPDNISSGQARTALGSVIRRTLADPAAFDANGWLRIGLSGHQPSLGEDYISTGSLYLCSAALLPLGLAAEDPFWRQPAAPSTWQKAWGQVDLPADHALRDQ